MLKILYTSIILFCINLNMQAQTSVIEDIDPSAPAMTFESETIDFGTIDQGSEAVRVFKFTNTGKSPLIISEVKGQCGCTTLPDGWSKAPIKPGASGSIKVKYDTTHTGAFDKKVTITSNAKLNMKEVTIKGVVKPAAGGVSAGGK
jgi:hypothetical protein